MTPYVMDAFSSVIENMKAGASTGDVDSIPDMAINFGGGKTSHLLTNSFWQFWISFGILGGAIAFALAKLGVSEIGFVLLAATLMGQTTGGVVLAPAWTPLFVIAALTIAALTIGRANASPRRRRQVGLQRFLTAHNRLSDYNQRFGPR